MRMKIILTMFLLFLFVNSTFSQKLEWLEKMRKVNLLSDTYEDVIKIFGIPVDGTSERELIEDFNVKEGRVDAIFESGECVITDYSNGKPIGWKVPAYTVSSLYFSPTKRIKLNKFIKILNLKLTDFHSYEVSDVPGAFIYENDKTGFHFSVDRKGKVEGIGFRPPEKLDYLHCQ